jgi:nucleoid-associated protein YgaU
MLARPVHREPRRHHARAKGGVLVGAERVEGLMKQNERMLVYLVTGFLAVILVVAVLFGRGGNPADAKAKLTTTQGLADILGRDAKDDAAGAGKSTADPTAGQLVGQQPLVAGKPDIAATQVEQALGASRRDRTVRFVRAKRGDSLDALVSRWCGAREPFLEEAKCLNEDLVVLRLGQEVAVPWVDDETVLAAWQTRQPQKPTVDGGNEPASAAVDPGTGGARTTFALPGERGGASPPAGYPPAGVPPPAAQAPPANSKPYTVKPGDSLWKVAERLYGRKNADRKIAEIRELNPGLSDTLRPGQTFLVPAEAEEPAPAPAKPTTGA